MGTCACAGFEDSFEQFLECCSASKGVDADAEAVDQNGQISFYLKGRPEALQRPLWLMVASMNAGDEPIHLEGDDWIPRQGRRRAGDGGDGSSCYDLIVVAVQEAILGGPVRLPRVNSNGGELPPRHCNELLAAFLEHLGQDYRVVTLLSRGAMVLLVFAWRFGPPLHDIETAAENTGLAHVFPNKGGLLAKLEVGGTSLCFVAAHLAAHSDHVQRRNADVTEILSGTKVSGMELDAPSYCHHSFFFGDLNYRLELRPEMRTSPREARETDELLEDDADVDLILQLIDAGDFQSLLQYDQLHVEMAAGRVLHGFSSALPTWPPTYRVLKGERGFHFDTKRVPSYCDRVLRRSLPGCQQQLQLRSFHAAPEVCTSDHKPISSTWTFMAAPVFQIPTSPATKGAWLRLSSICCRGVCEEGPIQLRCRSTPKVMEEVVVENTSNAGGNITWGGITLDLKVSKANLDAVHLLLELWSSAFLGVAALHCAVPLQSSAANRFEAPVICYGELRGHLSGFLTDVSPYDAKLADLWSCGVVLYVMVVGKYPFSHKEDAEFRVEEQHRLVLNRILELKYTLPAFLSASCADLVRRLLDPNPDTRITIPDIIQHPWHKVGLPPSASKMNDVYLQVTPENSQSDEDIKSIVSAATNRLDMDEELIIRAMEEDPISFSGSRSIE